MTSFLIAPDSCAHESEMRAVAVIPAYQVEDREGPPGRVTCFDPQLVVVCLDCGQTEEVGIP